jgi:hypothetical protein
MTASKLRTTAAKLYYGQQNKYYEDVVMLLLDKIDIVYSQDDFETAVLSVAVAIVTLFIRRKVIEPTFKDRKGWTPLFRAIKHRQGQLVELIVGREDFQTELKDNRGRTPLSKDFHSQMPLFWAIQLIVRRLQSCFSFKKTSKQTL